MLQLTQITAQDIKQAKLKKLLPELYHLKDLFEENAWHNHDQVFIHVLKVFTNTKKALKLDFIDKKQKILLKKHLKQKIVNRSRQELVLWSALLHDIAKPETFKQNPDNSTICANHEAQGAKKTRKILKRLNFPQKEINWLAEIVTIHGQPHEIIDPQKNSQTLKKDFSQLQQKHPQVFIELLLLSLADTQSAQLKQNNPSEYNFRIKSYKQLLNQLAV